MTKGAYLLRLTKRENFIVSLNSYLCVCLTHTCLLSFNLSCFLRPVGAGTEFIAVNRRFGLCKQIGLEICTNVKKSNIFDPQVYSLAVCRRND